MIGKMHGLDLFSGIGGLTVALSPWVRPVAYCENDRYAQGVLLSRMRSGEIGTAPIWDDVRTLRSDLLRGGTDIVYGGFPCQDISCAGLGAGLEGKRSGLFFEIVRLVSEIQPSFVFLENVAAITSRGLDRVAGEFSALRYDCRWGMLSAQDVGANHRRERWFLLAHSARLRWGQGSPLASRPREAASKEQEERSGSADGSRDEAMAHSVRAGLSGSGKKKEHSALYTIERGSRWTTEPNVGRVAHGIPHRVDRIRGLGNAVVPDQAREAFKRLMMGF
jgi:DNA (cytosine-5)-methyltransferase 1